MQNGSRIYIKIHRLSINPAVNKMKKRKEKINFQIRFNNLILTSAVELKGLIFSSSFMAIFSCFLACILSKRRSSC